MTTIGQRTRKFQKEKLDPIQERKTNQDSTHTPAMALHGPSVMEEVVRGVQVAGEHDGVAAALEHVLLLDLELRQLVERRHPRRAIPEVLPSVCRCVCVCACVCACVCIYCI